jgi:hypothetical protein
MKKIGIGLITYNAPEKIKQSAFSVPDSADEFVIVNDGTPYPQNCYPSRAHIIQHSVNMKVAKAKNDALSYLLEKGCEHIFLMEDDVIIKDPSVFDQYINASGKTGILHFNFALQGPYNFKKSNPEKNEGNLTDRIFNEKNAEPAPLHTIDYKNGAKISFYPACVGAFSYFRREVLEKTGLYDENFKNAWEHVDHTYRIIKKGYHPPFGWFADLADSFCYLGNIPNCMENSTIAKETDWKKNSEEGSEYFKKIHGHYPGKHNKTSKEGMIRSLSKIYNNYRDLILLIKFPTRGRPEKFFNVLDQYLSFMDDKENYRVVVSCDEDDDSMNNVHIIQKINSYKNVRIFFSKNKSKIEAVNANMDEQKEYDIILLASDDMIPVQKGFDSMIRENMRKYFPDMDGVLWFNDGYQGRTLNTLCILGKEYYKRFNYIYHPSYKSLWCDNEFTHVSQMLKRQVYIDKIIIKHDHPASNQELKEDEIYIRNQKFESSDRITYEQRKKKNFGLNRAQLFFTQFLSFLKPGFQNNNILQNKNKDLFLN